MTPMVMANCRRRIPVLGSVTWGKVRWSGWHEAPDIRGKRLLLPVHGIRETEERLERVYSEIVSRAVASHDLGVGFIWPGGSTIAVTWPLTVATAIVPCGQALRDVILALARSDPAAIDINAHSLGAAVVASAMRQAGEPWRFVRNVYLMAPAISRADLANFVGIRGKVHVCYNRHDPALASYRLWPPSNWIEPAVGKVGIGPTKMPSQIVEHDYTDLIGVSHGGYRRQSAYYQMMLEDSRNGTL